MKKEDGHKLDKLESQLYSRTNPIEARYKSHSLKSTPYDTPKSWGENESAVPTTMTPVRPPKNPFYKLLGIAFLFFAVSVGVAVYMFIGGGNTVSADNINLTVGGPIQIGGGQELALDVGIENKNNVALHLVDVIVEYPSGTKTSDDTHADLKRERVNIGDVKSGSFAHKIFKAILFGEESSTQNIKVSIEYRVVGSNAIFEKEKDFTLTLSSSPLSIVTTGLKEVTSGQQTQFNITLTSNSEKELKNVILKAEYPFGFTFKEATPKPTDGKDTWELGSFAPKETRTIKVNGTLEGQNDEERYFKFTAGIANSSNDSEIATVLALSSQSIAIKKPFIGLDLTLDDSASTQYSVSAGDVVRGSLVWTNNTSNTISNVQVTVALTGDPLDESSIGATEGGFYDSAKNIITWDKRTTPTLLELKPGDTGKVNFNFAVKDVKGSPQVLVDVGAQGDRISESNVQNQIVSGTSRIVKVATDLNLASKALHFSGPFENSGPMPPKSEQPTTYTVTWTITNSKNNVSNAKVIATLPSYMSWNSLIAPTTEGVTYDGVTGNIVWDVGNVPAGTGFEKASREVSFQVTLNPSVTQVGTAPVLLSSQTLTGTDNFAEVEVKDTRNPLTTRLTGDTGFTSNDEKVQP